MTDQEIEKIKLALANEFLNSFNINGLVAAAKHYSIFLATEKVKSLSEEDLKGLMADILNKEKEQAEQAAAAEKNSNDESSEGETRVTTSVNPEAQ
jgi:hypothetical protein